MSADTSAGVSIDILARISQSSLVEPSSYYFQKYVFISLGSSSHLKPAVSNNLGGD